MCKFTSFLQNISTQKQLRSQHFLGHSVSTFTELFFFFFFFFIQKTDLPSGMPDRFNVFINIDCEDLALHSSRCIFNELLLCLIISLLSDMSIHDRLPEGKKHEGRGNVLQTA